MQVIEEPFEDASVPGAEHDFHYCGSRPIAAALGEPAYDVKR